MMQKEKTNCSAQLFSFSLGPLAELGRDGSCIFISKTKHMEPSLEPWAHTEIVIIYFEYAASQPNWTISNWTANGPLKVIDGPSVSCLTVAQSLPGNIEAFDNLKKELWCGFLLTW